MRSFESGYLDRLPISQSMLRNVRFLGECRGREGLYMQQFPQVLDTLRQIAIIQSTESSNRIEGITAPLRRIEALVKEKTTPRNRSEQEIVGYRDALSRIHAEHAALNLDTGLVLELHATLFQYAGGTGGHWKDKDNVVAALHPDGSRSVRYRPVAAAETPAAMARLQELFRYEWQEGRIEPLVLIGAYALDFLCVHPFSDGNGRMARLLTLLLLYQAGFEVGRYVSLEKIIERSKESYYETLHTSSQGWHEGRHQLMPWLDYFLGVLNAAYKEFEDRVGDLTAARGAKTQLVLDAINRLPSRFRMVDIERLCPNVTRDMIRVVLRKLKLEGKVRSEGAGVAAVWLKGGNNP